MTKRETTIRAGLHPLSNDVILLDAMGRRIINVTSFDIDTKEAEIFIPTQDADDKIPSLAVVDKSGVREVARTRVKLPGARLVWKGSRTEVARRELLGTGLDRALRKVRG